MIEDGCLEGVDLSMDLMCGLLFPLVKWVLQKEILWLQRDDFEIEIIGKGGMGQLSFDGRSSCSLVVNWF